MALPLVLRDGFACGPDLMRIVDKSSAAMVEERRKRARLALAWTVYIMRSDDDHPLECRTKDLSSEGFYCYLPQPLTAGDSIRCIICIPATAPAVHERALSLNCKARVVRVENLSGNTY